jgi:hypothetical protein
MSVKVSHNKALDWTQFFARIGLTMLYKQPEGRIFRPCSLSKGSR